MPMRRASSSGSIYKVKDKKRRKPWRVRVTVGWEIDKDKNTCKQIIRTIGYFPSRQEAEKALVEYNECPYDIKNKNMTFNDVYEQWFEQYSKKCESVSSLRTITAAHRYCSGLYNMRIKDIKAYHLQECLDKGFVVVERGKDKGKKQYASATTKGRMKSVFNLMFDWAYERDLVDKNYARAFNLGSDIVRQREKDKRENIPFSSEEIEKLWESINRIPFADMVLIGIYSGWRPQELAILKIEDIDLTEQIMKGGLKTDAGRNRIVPIHPIILELIKKRYEEAVEMGSGYLFNDEDGQQGTFMTYDKYRRRFEKVMGRLDMAHHHPHETRHTFITKAKKVNMDEYILKRIVGHSIRDITEYTYTHRDFNELREAMALITE